ncbi:hypothetical protein D3C77_272920 [compost metagenome]
MRGLANEVDGQCLTNLLHKLGKLHAELLQPPLKGSLAHAQVAGDLINTNLAAADIGFNHQTDAGGQLGIRQAPKAFCLQPRQQCLEQTRVGSHQRVVKYLCWPDHDVARLIEAQRTLERRAVQADVRRLPMGKVDTQRRETLASDFAQQGVQRSQRELGILAPVLDAGVGDLIADVQPSGIQAPVQFAGLGMHHKKAAGAGEHGANVRCAAGDMTDAAHQAGIGGDAQSTQAHAQTKAGVAVLCGDFQQGVVLAQRDLGVRLMEYRFVEANRRQVGAKNVGVSLQQGFGINGVFEAGHTRALLTRRFVVVHLNSACARNGGMQTSPSQS